MGYVDNTFKIFSLSGVHIISGSLVLFKVIYTMLIFNFNFYSYFYPVFL